MSTFVCLISSFFDFVSLCDERPCLYRVSDLPSLSSLFPFTASRPCWILWCQGRRKIDSPVSVCGEVSGTPILTLLFQYLYVVYKIKVTIKNDKITNITLMFGKSEGVGVEEVSILLLSVQRKGLEVQLILSSDS